MKTFSAIYSLSFSFSHCPKAGPPAETNVSAGGSGLKMSSDGFGLCEEYPGLRPKPGFQWNWIQRFSRNWTIGFFRALNGFHRNSINVFLKDLDDLCFS
jgi:hypothetical protein